MLNRRSFITGLIAAPAIVKAASLMPVRGVIMDVDGAAFSSMAHPIRPTFEQVCDYSLTDDQFYNMIRAVVEQGGRAFEMGGNKYKFVYPEDREIQG